MAPVVPVKRGKALERVTPLARTPFRRTTDGPRLNRNQPDGMFHAERRTMRRQGKTVSTNAPAEVEALVFARATDTDGVLRCEIGGEAVRGFRGVDYSLQHRARRGSGGARNNPLVNQASALIVVCGHALSGHHYAADNDTSRYVNGWQVRRNSIERPDQVPVLLWHGWVLLDNHGSFTAADVAGGAA